MNGKLFQTCPLISLLRRQLPPKGKPSTVCTAPKPPSQGEAFGNPYKPQFAKQFIESSGGHPP